MEDNKYTITMVRRKTIWLAALGDREREFPTKKKAKEAEEHYAMEQDVNRLTPIFRQYFKTRFDIYQNYCVDCGKLIFEWESVWDGHRNEKGKYTSHNEHYQFVDGWRCDKCDKKIIELINKMIDFYHTEEGIAIILNTRDLQSIRHSDRHYIRVLMGCVEYWDKQVKFWAERKKNKKIIMMN